MNDERITMVDAQDRVIGDKTRAEMRATGGIYRVVHILVFNARGELLVQTRTDNKDWCAGKKDFAAGGIVLAGEDYAPSARRELQEELGVVAELEFCFKAYYEDTACAPFNQNWGAVYRCSHAGPFCLQPSEVAAANFMPLAQALRIPPKQVTPDTRQVLLAYLML